MPEPDAYVTRVEGELDLAACPDLESALAHAERSRPDRIVLDLDRLSFIDAEGLQTLLDASRRSASNGSRLRLTRPRGHVARMFRLTMLDVTLPFADPVGPRAAREGLES
jgi:anti-sigma B factor antagonist